MLKKIKIKIKTVIMKFMISKKKNFKNFDEKKGKKFERKNSI